MIVVSVWSFCSSPTIVMAVFKTYFSMCLVIVLGLNFVFAEESPKSSQYFSQEGPGNCSCGGFPTATLQENVTPLLSQTTGLVVKCDTPGMLTCKNLCVALATATKAKGPEILCNKLKNADELFLSAHYQVCDQPYTFAGMTAEEPLCCEDSKVKPCASTQKQDTATKDDAHITL